MNATQASMQEYGHRQKHPHKWKECGYRSHSHSSRNLLVGMQTMKCSTPWEECPSVSKQTILPFSPALGMIGPNSLQTAHILYIITYFPDMFGPTDLICSIQGTFNPIHRVRSKDFDKIENIPNCFLGEMRSGKSVVRSYE